MCDKRSFTDGRDIFAIDVEFYGSLVDDVEVVSLVSLLDHRLPANVDDRKHGVENVASLVLVQVREQNVFGDRLGGREGMKGLRTRRGG